MTTAKQTLPLSYITTLPTVEAPTTNELQLSVDFSDREYLRLAVAARAAWQAWYDAPQDEEEQCQIVAMALDAQLGVLVKERFAAKTALLGRLS